MKSPCIHSSFTPSAAGATVATAQTGRVSVTIDNPPYGRLDARVVADLASVVARVQRDPSVGAVVLKGAHRSFAERPKEAIGACNRAVVGTRWARDDARFLAERTEFLTALGSPRTQLVSDGQLVPIPETGTVIQGALS